MKLDVCDICYYSKKGLVESTHRIGYKDAARIGVCKEHQNWGKEQKSREVFYRELSKLQSLYFGLNEEQANQLAAKEAA